MPVPNIPMTYKQYGQVPFFYINGLQISNDATTPNSLLDIAIGTCLDSSETYQMDLLTPCVINSANKGLNGIDIGTIAASTVYSVYLVSDPVTYLPTGAMISVANGVTTFPYMPFGYSAYRRIGFVTTDASSHFLKGYWTDDSSSSRLFMYDAPQASNITAGASASYVPANLIHLVPNLNNVPVWIYSVFTPGAASDTLKMQPANATGDAVTITAQVTSVVVTSNSLVLSQPVSISSVISPAINYKVSGTDTVAIDVAGYQFTL
jgi:hypothetical protein